MTPNDPQLPSLRQLNRGTLIAAGAAAVILVTTVLPAEYGIDPTGIGRVIGLTQMGERKVAEAGASSAPTGPVAGDSVTDTPDGGKRVQIVLGPYGGREVKAVMKAGGAMHYDWATDGEAVEFEFHGEADNARDGDYSSYEKGRKASAKGDFTAAFAGQHGWYWHNLTAKPVTITAIVKGAVDKFAPIYAEGGNAGTQPAATPVAAGGMSDTTPYHTELPMKQFMADVISHSANEIWKKQGYISDDKGVRSLFPKGDKEWKEAENAGFSLAEMTNVLLIPGRRVPEADWDKGVDDVRKAALKLAAIARKKDENAYMEAGLELNEACAGCHKRYAPGVD